MTAGAVPLAFVAGALSILSPCVLPILPIVLGAAASEHRFGPAALAAGLSGPLRGHRALCRDHRLFDRPRSWRLPQRRGRADDRDRGNSLGAAVADAARHCRRAGCDLGQPVCRRRATRWHCGAIARGAAARRSVEPLRRPDARSGGAAGSARARPAPGCGDHVRFWSGRGPTAAGARHGVAAVSLCAGAINCFRPATA